MEKRERKEIKRRKKSRSLWLWLILAGLIICAGIYLWFDPYGVELLGGDEPLEASPLAISPEPTPEPAPTPEPEPDIPRPQVCLYTARLSLEEEAIYGSLRIHYINTGDATIFAVPFHLYPNTQSADALTITRLALDGREAFFTHQDGLLNVPLVVELAPGEDCVIFMELRLDISDDYREGHSLPYALPAVAVYENGWLTDVAPQDAGYTLPASYSLILGEGLSCDLTETEPGYYYGENLQGLTLTID